LFQFFYTILLLTLLATSSPFLVLSAILRKKHRKSIPARFFFLRNWRVDLQNKIWFHGASLGEVNALKPFLKEISKENEILLTTTTDTGFNSGINSFYTRFLPFEPLLYFWQGYPKTLVVVEAEFWFLGVKRLLLVQTVGEFYILKALKLSRIVSIFLHDSTFNSISDLIAIFGSFGNSEKKTSKINSCSFLLFTKLES
jgi:hypothetical protein